MFKVQVGEILQFSELAQQDGDLGIGEKIPAPKLLINAQHGFEFQTQTVDP